jgi:hypothetical protein
MNEMERLTKTIQLTKMELGELSGFSPQFIENSTKKLKT